MKDRCNLLLYNRLCLTKASYCAILDIERESQRSGLPKIIK